MDCWFSSLPSSFSSCSQDEYIQCSEFCQSYHPIISSLLPVCRVGLLKAREKLAHWEWCLLLSSDFGIHSFNYYLVIQAARGESTMKDGFPHCSWRTLPCFLGGGGPQAAHLSQKWSFSLFHHVWILKLRWGHFRCFIHFSDNSITFSTSTN